MRESSKQSSLDLSQKPAEIKPESSKSTISDGSNKSSDDPGFKRNYTNAHLARMHQQRETQAGMQSGTLLQRIVYSNTFEVGSAFVIMANTVTMAVELQYVGLGAGYDLRAPSYGRPAEDVWPGARMMLDALETLFSLVFIVELLLRIAAMRLRAAKSGWIWFDGVLVLTSITEQVGTVGAGFDPTIMRLMRLLRLPRLLKAMKSVAAFDALFLLLKCLQASFSAAFWSILIILTVQLTLGMLIGQLLQDFIADVNRSEDVRRAIFLRFGTFTRSMHTMFEITFANWGPTSRLLGEEVNELWTLFFVVYRCMFIFAVLKVITALFITETYAVLEKDDEVMITKKRRAKANLAQKLTNIYTEIDRDGDGSVTWHEFEEVVLADEMIRTWMSTIDIAPHDFTTLFHLVETGGDGEVDLAEFLATMPSLRGAAKSIDMQLLTKTVERIEAKLSSLEVRKRGVEQDGHV